MDSGVGAVLRKARNRRKIELAEVEAATRIRLRYLRAIEDEEWDVLPDGFYRRGFIRTYAAFLGLDGERLVEDYRASVEPWHRAESEQRSPAAADAVPGRFRAPLAGLAVVAGVIAVAALAIVAIPSGGGEDPPAPPPPGPPAERPAQAEKSPAARTTGVSVRLTASAEVWVCVLDARGRELVDGLILAAGAAAGPFHSGSFTVSFGNGEVKMLIDGREAEIAATSSPIGYAIDSAGELSELGEADRPTCT
ncbi:MAG TPA: helix-turn-helix domain-containing protein [Solirubrobacterales bacterium]|nr:helix-turn-helix domain-containing protein [Solirubrobacterales bacterium]